MKFYDIKDKIQNNPGFKSLKEIKQAGLRVVKERDGDRYFLAKKEELKPLLVKLGDIAEIKSGIITGTNAKYYNTRPEEFNNNQYSLVFKSPKEVNKVLLTEKDAISIIKIKNIPFEIRRAPLLWVDLRGDKHLCHFNKDNLPFEHNFYGIYGKKIDNENLCLLLNCTLNWFFVEIVGRKGLGGGAIRLVGIDLILLPCFLLSLLKLYNFKNFINRKIYSAFEECGIDPKSKTPIEEQEPNPLLDRAELDKIVFDTLGLTEDERKDIYRSVCRLVWNRISKAKSV